MNNGAGQNNRGPLGTNHVIGYGQDEGERVA